MQHLWEDEGVLFSVDVNPAFLYALLAIGILTQLLILNKLYRKRRKKQKIDKPLKQETPDIKHIRETQERLKASQEKLKMVQQLKLSVEALETEQASQAQERIEKAQSTIQETQEAQEKLKEAQEKIEETQQTLQEIKPQTALVETKKEES